MDALNPSEPAKVVVGKDFHYVPSAHFGKNLKRHLRANGFLFAGLKDYSFELDDENNPFFVITTYHPSLGWGGKVVDGVVIVNPVDGKFQEYATADVPAWVDRVYPEAIVNKNLNFWGNLSGGWLNAVFTKAGVQEAEDTTIVYTPTGHCEFVTSLHGTNAADDSLTGVVYTDTRTGKSRLYRASGGTDNAILEAVSNKVGFKQWRGVDPVWYNLYGHMTAVVPLLGASDTFQGVALVVVNSLSVSIGNNITGALREYQKQLSRGTSDLLVRDAEVQELTGIVSRAASEVREGDTSYYFRVGGLNFTAGSDASPLLPLMSVGDEVTLEYLASDEPVLPVKKVSVTIKSMDGLEQ